MPTEILDQLLWMYFAILHSFDVRELLYVFESKLSLPLLILFQENIVISQTLLILMSFLKVRVFMHIILHCLILFNWHI